jgi:hypothetical protein
VGMMRYWVWNKCWCKRGRAQGLNKYDGWGCCSARYNFGLMSGTLMHASSSFFPNRIDVRTHVCQPCKDEAGGVQTVGIFRENVR